MNFLDLQDSGINVSDQDQVKAANDLACRIATIVGEVKPSFPVMWEVLARMIAATFIVTRFEGARRMAAFEQFVGVVREQIESEELDRDAPEHSEGGVQ